MVRFRKTFLPIFLAGVGLLGLATRHARADILVTLDLTSVVNHGATTTYGYMAFLNPGFELDSAGFKSNGANFFTLYDIPGYVPGSATATMAGFGSITEQSLGFTPLTQSPPDSASMLNLTFHYTSGTEIEVPLGSPNFLLGTFTFDSTIPNASPTSNIFYSAATQKNLPGVPSDEDLANNTSLVAGPSPIPEPASLALVGIGIPLLGVFYLLRRRNQRILA
jgi:hypothetical protein